MYHDVKRADGSQMLRIPSQGLLQLEASSWGSGSDGLLEIYSSGRPNPEPAAVCNSECVLAARLMCGPELHRAVSDQLQIDVNSSADSGES